MKTPGAWWTTRVGVERDVYPEFPPAPEVPATTEPAEGLSAEDWKNAVELAAPAVHPLLGELSTLGAPVPEVGFELLDTRGAVLAEAELGWPAHEVAVLLPGQDVHVAEFQRAGWRAFASSAGDLAEAVTNAFPR